MFYSAFYDELPKIAEQETRSIIVVDQKQSLPKGVYSFFETYCTDKTVIAGERLSRFLHPNPILRTPLLQSPMVGNLWLFTGTGAVHFPKTW